MVESSVKSVQLTIPEVDGENDDEQRQENDRSHTGIFLGCRPYTYTYMRGEFGCERISVVPR